MIFKQMCFSGLLFDYSKINLQSTAPKNFRYNNSLLCGGFILKKYVRNGRCYQFRELTTKE